MSSSGRFQSHLFNFVSRQIHNIADQTKKAVRHLKVATIWGTQILLYPIYVVVQSTRLIGQQINQAVRRSRLQLSKVIPQLSPAPASESLTVDTPIQQVLTAIQDSWLLTSADSKDLESVQSLTQMSASYPTTIQGIASLIPTRTLVLVTIDNQVIDILTSEQQDDLKQRIIWEMANYWRYWRRHYIAQTHPTLLLPLEDRDTLLPPVRVFRQIIAWVQSGPIAIAANLFQESALVAQPTELDWFTTDLTLSAFNPMGLIPRQLPTAADLSGLIQQLPSLGEMESLIRAAMRYFFGNRSRKQLMMGVGCDPAVAESWLTSEELFGNPATLQASTAQSHLRGKSATVRIEKTFKPLAHLSAHPDPLPGNRKLRALPSHPTVTIVHSLRNWLKRSLPQQKSHARSQSPIVHQTPNHSRLTQSTQPKLTTQSEPSQNLVEVTLDHALAESSQNSVQSTPLDYIETKASAIGYVKSPLTRFLEWLDTGIVWLERKLAAFWNFLTRRS